MVKSNEPWQINKEIGEEKKTVQCAHINSMQKGKRQKEKDIEQEREQMGKFITMTVSCTISQYF